MDNNEARSLSMQAQMDQTSEAMSQLAALYRRYYLSLIKEGFTDSEALQLVVAYQNLLMGNAKGEAKG